MKERPVVLELKHEPCAVSLQPREKYQSDHRSVARVQPRLDEKERTYTKGTEGRKARTRARERIRLRDVRQELKDQGLQVGPLRSGGERREAAATLQKEGEELKGYGLRNRRHVTRR